MSEKRSNQPTIVDPNLVGDVWSDALPSEDPVLFGHVEIEPKGSFEARSLQTFTITYTVGRHGLDDTGGLRVVLRTMGDVGRLQSDDPAARNYVSAVASNGAGLSLEYQHGGYQRPWGKNLRLMVTRGCLREGETITLTFGDRSGGSPGMQMQTFCEEGFEFKVLADVCATGHFLPLAQSPSISIVPGAAALWRAVLPTLRRPGERFHLGIKAEDKWGNPTDQAEAKLRIVTNLEVANLPADVDYPLGTKSLTFEDLAIDEEGTLALSLEAADGTLLAQANPLLIRTGDVAGYWADLHGQSGESIGIGTSRQYFTFAREHSFLDATSHQANDFQVNNAFWATINQLTAEFHEDHRFVTFPGYEWSGNTAVGGDRNVFFRTEGRPIRRSSHALLPDRSDIDSDAGTAAALFEAMAEEDVVIFAHVGGRYADIDFAHDARLENSMELHSAWGSFEWLIEDCFRLGHRVGVVCNSDGHKGRPGASYPGASMFGAYGGLTCFYAEELTRDGLFDCLRKRHHYGTTGNRPHLEVTAQFDSAAQRFDKDPKAFDDAASEAVQEAMMGDIVQSDSARVILKVFAQSQTPIERIEIRNGPKLLHTLRGYNAADLGNRIRVIWSGAEYRGRGRETHWQGEARFHKATIARFAKINAWNHERRLEVTGDGSVAFDAITTGNFSGFDVWLDEASDARLALDCGLLQFDLPLSQVGLEDTAFDAGGLARRIRVFRLPEINPHTTLAGEFEIELDHRVDNPLWVCVTTEDGFQAWSSPIYVFKEM